MKPIALSFFALWIAAGFFLGGLTIGIGVGRNLPRAERTASCLHYEPAHVAYPSDGASAVWGLQISKGVDYPNLILDADVPRPLGEWHPVSLTLFYKGPDTGRAAIHAVALACPIVQRWEMSTRP